VSAASSRQHRGIGRAQPVARRAVEAIQRALRDRQLAPERARFLEHGAQVLADRVDVEGGASRVLAPQRGGDGRAADLEHVRPAEVSAKMSISRAGSMPSGSQSESASPNACQKTSSGRLIASFIAAPAPTGPTCSTRRHI